MYSIDLARRFHSVNEHLIESVFKIGFDTDENARRQGSPGMFSILASQRAVQPAPRTSREVSSIREEVGASCRRNHDHSWGKKGCASLDKKQNRS